MSQFQDTPERDDNEIGNDSPADIASSLSNFDKTLKSYKEGQKTKGNHGDGGDGDDGRDSQTPEQADGSDSPNVQNNNWEQSSNPQNNDQANPTNASDSSGSQNRNQPDSSQTGKQNSNAGSNTPSNSSSGNGANSVTGGNGASTNAGTVGKAGVESAPKSAQPSYEAAQAAQKGAEAAKAASEAASVAQAAAEGAAEGSVVPGAGTVAVAAARVAWASRHTIMKVVAVVLLICLMLVNAVEALPSAIWQTVFDKEGDSYTSIEEVYNDLEKTVQEVITEAYNDTIEKAEGTVNSYGTRPDLNELRDVSLGPQLSTDICDVIAYFTVRCEIENKAPTKKYLKKLLRENKDKFFPVTELKMKKIEYNIYEKFESSDPSYKPVIAFLSDEKGLMTKYLAEHNGYAPSIGDVVSAGGEIVSPVKPVGEIAVWIGKYNTYGWYDWYAVGEGVLHNIKGTETMCSHDEKGNKKEISGIEVQKAVQVSYREYLYIKSNGDFGVILDEEKLKGFYYVDRENTEFKSFEKDGIDCIRVTVNQFNRQAMLDCFEIDEDAQYPLVADYTGSEDNGWNIDKIYTPSEYTCGMAITAYTETLKNALYGSGTVIKSAPGVNVYEYKVINSINKGVPDVEVSMFKDKDCTKLVMTATSDEKGVAKFENFGNELYYIKETNKNTNMQNLLYQLKKEVYILDNRDKHCMTWGTFPVSESGFICPIQVSDENQVVKITSYFGYRTSPTSGASSNHGGLDIVILDSKGNSITQGYPIRAAADGKVIFSGVGSGYGNYVQIQHESGHQTLYAHNSVLCVEYGDEVKQGQIIAYGGSTGVSTGPHCHFEVRSPDGTRLNPLNYLPLNN